MSKEYIILGSNNFWYSAGSKNKKEAIDEAINILCGEGSFEDPESGHRPDVPEKVYIYKAELVKEIEETKKSKDDENW